MFSLICVWINGWVNNREAGDLRRHRGHFDVNVMILFIIGSSNGIPHVHQAISWARADLSSIRSLKNILMKYYLKLGILIHAL